MRVRTHYKETGLRLARLCLTVFLGLLVLSSAALAQVEWDDSGNGKLNGTFRFREVIVDTDEHPRYRKENGDYILATSMEQLARLRPVFRKGGTVTAGNASGINDGAAALVGGGL